MRAVWRYPVLALVALGVLGIPNQARAQNAAAHSADDYNNFLELNIYAGYSDYHKIDAGLGGKINGGAIIGGRVTENISNYFGLEQDLNVYSWNKYSFLSNPPDGPILTQPFPIHTVQPAFDVVMHFTPRDHKFRPFVAMGLGAAIDVLGKNANQMGVRAAARRRVHCIPQRRAFPRQLRSWSQVPNQQVVWHPHRCPGLHRACSGVRLVGHPVHLQYDLHTK